MKPILQSVNIIETRAIENNEFEVCATAEAHFDEGHRELIVQLDSFIRPVDMRCKEQHLFPNWLPKKQSAREHVSREEALDLAKDIFHSWSNTVRAASAACHSAVQMNATA